MNHTPNRHPSDQLFDVRQRIKALEDEVDALRAYLLAHPEDLTGDEHQASVGTYQRKYVDLDGLEREIGTAMFQRFVRFRPITFVTLKECERDAA